MTTLTIALEKVNFLPAGRVTDDTSVLTLKNLVFEPLLRWDRGFARPALFAHWSHSEGGRRWRFTLRDGATFHDGRPAVAEDVLDFVAGILQSVDTFGMKWSYSRYLRDAVLSAPDDRTVEVANPTPFSDILDIFCEFYLCRMDAEGAPVLGTGPYRVEAFEAGRRAELQNVVSAGGPDRIVAICEPDADARYGLLKAGAVDAALNLERVHGRLDFDPRFQWGRAANTMSVMAYLNCSSGLFSHPQARLAINLAIDRQALVADVFDGLAVPAATIVSPWHLGMGQARVAPIAYDPGKARALLDAAGGAGEIVLRTPTFMPERAPEASRFIADALERLGCKVTLDVVEDRPGYARQVGNKQIGDIALFDSSPQSTYRVLDDKISARNRAIWWQGYDDPQAEALIAAANAAVEDDAREAAYARCLERLNAAPPWLYLVHPIDVFAARADVPGLSIDMKGTLVIDRAP